MKPKTQLRALLIFLIMMFCSFLFLQHNADATTIITRKGNSLDYG